MKKIVVKLISLTLTMMVLLSATTLSASADGVVTYDGNAGDFIFAPEHLFGSFSDFVPGDSITERITIDNDISDKVKIKVYLRCSGVDEKSEGFLSQMTMNIDEVDRSKLFSGSADTLVGLSEWKYLGTVYSGGDIQLDLTLNVPVEMDNDFMNAEARVKWEFRVDEFPMEPDDPAPDTSDGITVVLLPPVVALVVIGVTAGCIVKKKQAKR